MGPGIAIAAAVVAMAAVAFVRWPRPAAPPAPGAARPDAATQAPADSLLAAIAAAPRDSARAAEVRGVLADWESAWQKVMPGFALDSLGWMPADSLAPASMPLTTPQLDSLYALRARLTWSADRRYALDPAIAPAAIAAESLAGTIAGTTPRLHDLGGRRTLALAGPAGRFAIEAAGWTGDRRFVLAGAWIDVRAGEPLVIPAIELHDLDTGRRVRALAPVVGVRELEAERAMLELVGRRNRRRPRASPRAARSERLRRRAATRNGEFRFTPTDGSGAEPLLSAPCHDRRARRSERAQRKRSRDGRTCSGPPPHGGYFSLRRTSAARRSLASARPPSLSRSTSTPSSLP
jgi:hypothetical protein